MPPKLLKWQDTIEAGRPQPCQLQVPGPSFNVATPLRDTEGRYDPRLTCAADVPSVPRFLVNMNEAGLCGVLTTTKIPWSFWESYGNWSI